MLELTNITAVKNKLIPQASKDAIAACLLNANQEKLCALAQQAALEYGIRLSIEHISAAV